MRFLEQPKRSKCFHSNRKVEHDGRPIINVGHSPQYFKWLCLVTAPQWLERRSVAGGLSHIYA